MANTGGVPPDIKAVQTPIEAGARRMARRMIRNTKEFPEGTNYDWLPFMTVLCMYNRNIGPDPNDPTVVIPATPQRDPGDAHDRVPPNTPDYGGMRQDRAPPQKPNTGGRDHVWYIPAWSHPRHTDSFVTGPRGDRRLRRTVDPTNTLRPALLPQDALRNPTDYAKRWGIFPGDLGGRSHLSPTLSPSRDPLADYATQRDLLSDVERQHLVNETRNRGLGSSADPNHINPTVLEEYFASNQVSTGKQFADEIAAQLPNTDFEELVQYLRQKRPETLAANRNFIDGVLRDQDWQRFLFQEMSTDEMIRENVHTMSNAETYDLKGPIHPWFSRYRWVARGVQGASPAFPKFMYTLNGERKEWDAYRNDDVWGALQPALQLVTRILNSRHPHYRDIMDANTRQLIPDEQDPRHGEEWGEELTVTHLTRMVKRDNIDMKKTHPEIRKLHEMGYDWETNVRRLVDATLHFEIGGCHFCAITGEYSDEMTYGYNYKYEDQEAMFPRSYNIISIAAEMIWPLLIPETSKSEKLVASFLIAAVILHELTHAIVNCLQYLTADEDKQPPEQSEEITKLLLRLGDELWEPELFIGEHPYEDCGVAEHGSQLEMEMFGWNVQCLLGTGLIISRDADLDTMVLRASQWPGPKSDGDSLVGVGSFPSEAYSIPTPIDYVAKFFTEEFWSTDFMRYGHDAFKQLSYNRIQKVLMRSNWAFSQETLKWFGEADGQFLRTLSAQLLRYGYPILGSYIKDLYIHATRQETLPGKWLLTLDRMSKVLNIDTLIKEFRVHCVTAGDLNKMRLSSQAEMVARYAAYCRRFGRKVIAGEASGGPDSYEKFRANIEEIWVNVFREGGQLMKLMAEIYRKMQTDIAVLQRIVLEFFSLEHSIQDGLYLGAGSVCPSTIGIAYRRMEGLMEAADEIAQTALGFSWLPQLDHVQAPWEQWSARFRANSGMYNDLLHMLNPEIEHPTRVRNYDPDDITWKAQLKTIPSSFWKKRSDRLALLAQHQYNQVDQRIRDALDHASAIMDRVVGTVPFPGAPNTDDVNERITSLQLENQKRIEDNNASRQDNALFRIPAAVAQHQAGLSGAQGTNSQNDPMDIVYDEMIQDSSANGNNPSAVPPIPAVTVTRAAMPGANVGVQFGQPSQFRAARMRVRTPPPARRRSASPIPTPSPSRQRTRRTSVAARRGTQASATTPPSARLSPGRPANNLAFTSWAAGDAPGFGGSGSPQPLGTGDPFVSTTPSGFPGNQPINPAHVPFPHPYATPNTLTQDVQDFALRKALWEYEAEMENQSGVPYQTNAPYREAAESSPEASPLKPKTP